MSFILLLFRGVSIEKLFKRFMDGGEKKKSFSVCLSLLKCAVLILSVMFHSMLHTNKVLGWVLKVALLVSSFLIVSYVRLPLHSNIQQTFLGLTVVVIKGNDEK